MSSTPNFKYIIAEDEHLHRRSIIKKITSLALPLTLAGEASNGLDAIPLIEKHSPNIVLTDIQMPQYSGLELAKHISKNHPNIRVILLSGYSDFGYAQSAIKYGVKDYLLKPVTAEALKTSLQNIFIEMDSENKELTNQALDVRSLSQEDICNLMINYLKENYNLEISLGDMASKFGFTVEYLGKIFKKYTGETPSKYLIKLRMNQAKYLLRNQPELEINKVGQLVGYKDAFYFSRAFKSHVGMHPSDYRNTLD